MASTNATNTVTKPNVIGIYAISGSGKSTVMEALKYYFRAGFLFFEGSEQLEKTADMSMDEFKLLSKSEQDSHRACAIQSIQDRCREAQSTGIVTGHYLLYSRSDKSTNVVGTDKDFEIFTHILYLKFDIPTIQRRRQEDGERVRPDLENSVVEAWQGKEHNALLDRCYKAQIPFYAIPEHLKNEPEYIYDLIRHAIAKEEINNQFGINTVQALLDQSIKQDTKAVLVFDADKTLSASDSGKLWVQNHDFESELLERIFKTYGHTTQAFKLAETLYIQDKYDKFESVCARIANEIELYPQIKDLLECASGETGVEVIVVTCGLRRVWERVLDANGFLKISVFGNGRRYTPLVTPTVKAAVIEELQKRQIFVTAFGDSPLDIPMLAVADNAVVVVGDEISRSQSMDAKLRDAIRDGALKARQAVMGNATARNIDFEISPGVQTNMLPQVDISSDEFLKQALQIGQLAHPVQSPETSLSSSSSPSATRNVIFNFHDATNTAASQILATSMRNAGNQGPALRSAHHAAGRHLALSQVGSILGLELYKFPHVQGAQVDGLRIANESDTLIIALMRGGEPMAFGVNEI